MKTCWDGDLFYRTVEFAMKKHNGQTIMLSKMPYIGHVFEVFGECVRACIEGNSIVDWNLLMQVALLHDVIEDTDCTYKELATLFGDKVANGVLALSKNDSLPYKDRLEDSLDRICLQEKEVAMIKLADRIVNLQEKPLEWSQEKLDSYKNDANMILNRLGHVSEILSARLKIKIQQY